MPSRPKIINLATLSKLFTVQYINFSISSVFFYYTLEYCPGPSAQHHPHLLPSLHLNFHNKSNRTRRTSHVRILPFTSPTFPPQHMATLFRPNLTDRLLSFTGQPQQSLPTTVCLLPELFIIASSSGPRPRRLKESTQQLQKSARPSWLRPPSTLW